MSKKRLITGLLAGGLMVGMLPGVASAAPGHDEVTGAFRVIAIGGGTADVSVSAHGTGAGTDARGNLNFRGIDGPVDKATAEVECIFADGDRAVIVGSWKKGAQPFGPQYPFAIVVVEDNGQPGEPTPDRAVAGGSSSGVCDAVAILRSLTSLSLLLHGNVRVVDAD